MFYLLLPVHAVEKFAWAALVAGFYLIHRTDFHGYAHNEAKVSALTISRTDAAFATSLMTIYETHRVYTKDSERYLSPFLLRFTKNFSILIYFVSFMLFVDNSPFLGS